MKKNKPVLNFDPALLMKRLTEDNFALFLEAVICHAQTFLIGIDPENLDSLKSEFARVFPDAIDQITLVDRAEYNKNWRFAVYSTEYKNCYVFDYELGVVIKTPEKNKKSKFGMNIIGDLKKTHGSEAQIVMLKNWNKKVDLFAEKLVQLIAKDAKLKPKDLIKTLEKENSYNEKLIPFDVLAQRLLYTKGEEYAKLL